MREWDRHKLALSNPPTDRMRDVHKLHITQSVPMLDENSALRPNMPQRDDDEGGKPKRLSFSPASSVWGQMGRSWTSGDRNARTTELVTWRAHHHHHVNTCLTHSSNWTRVARNIDLLVDITLRQDFVGAGHNGLNQGQFRNPDNPDKLLDSAAADKIRHYRAPYRQNRHVSFLPACMTTSGRIHGEFLRLLYFISSKQAVDYFEALGYDAHKAEFCHCRRSMDSCGVMGMYWGL
jgi:hypothetical protein